MIWNEAGEWIFSDEAHDLMDRNEFRGARTAYRDVDEDDLRTYGYGIGLFKIKRQPTHADPAADSARHPQPHPTQDLGAPSVVWSS